MSTPATVTTPGRGRISPVRTAIKVDLPAPFGPRSAQNRPAGRVKLTPSSAGFAPQRWDSPATARAGSVNGDLDPLIGAFRPRNFKGIASRLHRDKADLHRARLIEFD